MSHHEIHADHEIVSAGQDDVSLLCEILASAFSQDPVMQWMLKDSSVYDCLFRAEVEPLYSPKGKMFINRAQSGCALWLPPGVNADAPFRWSTVSMLWKMYRRGGIQSLKRGTALETVMGEHHITEPHYYLFAIGAKLGNQGKGIGSALLEAGLKMVDSASQPAYLESTNIKNNPLYERFGFSVIKEVSLPDEGPNIWPMYRPARG